MPVNIVVADNVKAVSDQLTELQKKQLPFATALALTRTAQEVREQSKDTLTDFFTVRGRWVTGSMRAHPAKKGPAPKAIAGSIYDPMVLHAEGGEKDAGSVPVWARGKPTDRTKPATWPGALAQKRHFFLAPFQVEPYFKVGRGVSKPVGLGLFQRIGTRKERSHLKLWWTLRETVQVERDWPFWELASTTVHAVFADNLWAAMEQAMATARPPR